MKIEMTNEELLNLYNMLGEINTRKEGYIKFKYSIAKNRSKLETDAKALLAAIQYPDPHGLLNEYNKKVQEVTRKYSTDDDDKPNVRRNPQTGQLQREVPIKKLNEHAAEIEALRDTYKGLFEDTEYHREKTEALLDEKIEVELHAMKLSQIPDDIPERALNMMYAFIIDDTEEETGLKSVK